MIRRLGSGIEQTQKEQYMYVRFHFMITLEHIDIILKAFTLYMIHVPKIRSLPQVTVHACNTVQYMSSKQYNARKHQVG